MNLNCEWLNLIQLDWWKEIARGAHIKQFVVLAQIKKTIWHEFVINEISIEKRKNQEITDKTRPTTKCTTIYEEKMHWKKLK